MIVKFMCNEKTKLSCHKKIFPTEQDLSFIKFPRLSRTCYFFYQALSFLKTWKYNENYHAQNVAQFPM